MRHQDVTELPLLYLTWHDVHAEESFNVRCAVLANELPAAAETYLHIVARTGVADEGATEGVID